MIKVSGGTCLAQLGGTIMSPWLRRILPALRLLTIAVAPAPSFDCAKSGNAVDRLICSDEGLATLDRELAERYDALHRALSPEGLAVLLTSQRKWLASRSRCASKEVPHDQGVTCLSGLYSDRTDELNAQYSTADDLTVESGDITRHLPAVRVEESDRYPVLLGPKPRVDAFNRYITQRLNLAKGMFAASGIKLDAKPDGDTTFSRSYEIHRFDDRMLSIEIFEAHESYFGHGWRSEYAINWDLRRGRPLRVSDIFLKEPGWQQAIYSLAMKAVREQGDINNPESWFNDGAVDDDDAWLFDDDGAVLLLGHGERSMVGASADAAIPYDAMRPFVRPDAPMAAPVR
jgi:uncharacterized protein